MRIRIFLITLAIILLNTAPVSASQKAHYQSFKEQLDNSGYQAVVSVVSIKDVKMYNSDYTEYTLKIVRELSFNCKTEKIKAIYKAGYDKMEKGRQYLILSEYYHDYKELVFDLSSYYSVEPDRRLVLKSIQNDYSLPAGDFTLDDVEKYNSGFKEKKTIEHIDVEKYFDFALSNCTNVSKGYLYEVSKNDSYSKKLTAFFESNKRIGEKPKNSNYSYASHIIAQDIKGGLFKPYIIFSLWINDRGYYLVIAKGSPNWNRALQFYNEFQGDEYNTFTDYFAVIKLALVILFVWCICFIVIRKRIKKLKVTKE